VTDWHAAPGDPDGPLLKGLKRGDEAAFMTLVERYHSAMVRLAMTFVPSRAVAEEVTQEAWLGVLNGIDRFEGRSTLKTWIFRILVNRAKTRGQRESRSVPFSSLATGDDEPAVDADRFLGPDSATPGAWQSPPASWGQEPEQKLIAAEGQAMIVKAIETLPPAQRRVITLRDVHGLGAEEVRDLLDLSDGNQRVLLHRARSKVRQLLERYFSNGSAS
jgi:RNA polymerase sigma-70 factor (ECF subfamily)